MEKATIYDYARMCNKVKQCGNCPMLNEIEGNDLSCRGFIAEHPDKANEIILKWCKEHPVETRQSEFLRMFPNARKDRCGTVDIAPCIVEKGRYDMTADSCTMSHKYTTCAQCRKEYWLAEVDE